MSDGAKIAALLGTSLLAAGVMEMIGQFQAEAEQKRQRREKKVPPVKRHPLDPFIQELVYNEKSGAWQKQQ